MDFLKNDSPEQVNKTLKDIKKVIDTRNKKIMDNRVEIANRDRGLYETKKASWKNKGWSKGKTRKVAAQIPSSVYFANPQYWDDLIANGSFKTFKRKHPELIISQ